jgi:hypothetical protein
LGESSKLKRVILHLNFRYGHSLQIILVLPLVILFTVSCSPTRRLTDNEYLLNKSKVDLKSKEIDAADLKPYEKQSPNKTILGLKFHLFLYNLTSPEKTKGIPGWLKKIGEEPVIWDPVLTSRTVKQFKEYLEAKGYYDARVSDSISLRNKRADILYTIILNEPYRIENIRYRFEDQDLAKYVYEDTINCLIKKGGRFDKEVLQMERQRLEESLKNQGFYRFSKEYIFYDAFEGNDEKKIDLQITFKENVTGVPDPETKVRHHYRYKIGQTFIYPNYTLYSSEPLADSLEYDTVKIDDNNIIYFGKHHIKPETVLFPNQCTPGSLYRLDKVKKTYNSYSALGLFRLITIQFKEHIQSMPDTGAFKYLNCMIELSPRKVQSYQTEIVGTNSSGNLGGRASLRYNNYNLFRGAEKLEVRLTGAIERIKKSEYSETPQTLYEGGIETSLSLPKFLVPFRAEQFTHKFNPQTSINVSYNYQNRPNYYIRTIANTSFSYRWKGNSFNTHQLFPVDFNYVWLPQGIINDTLRSYIDKSSEKASFTNHTILAARYTFEYTNQVVEKNEDFIFLRTSIESAGNVIYGIRKLASYENDTSFLNVPYFRYLKTDIDFRIHDQITEGNKMVYRICLGLGYPLGSHTSIPIEKMYSPGGPNDIRAWSFYELGPGSDTTKLLANEYKLGDIQLVANLEYRFKLFWVIEGAMFVDAGNVWTVNERKEQPSGVFRWNRFYKEIAVGAGVGTRFDFSFLLLRTDFGIKFRDPAILQGSRWIDINRAVKYSLKRRVTFQFGIGYPF